MAVAIGIALALAALAFALGFALAGFAMGIRRQTLDEARAWQEAHYDLSWYDGLQKQDYVVAADDGYALHAQRLVNPEPSGRCVVISHGYTDNRFGALKYARTYLDLGFDVIVYDLRGHGANAPDHCTYSIRESRDLLAVLRDAAGRCPGAKVWGVHGESLGAATSVALLKYAPPIDFAVADCGFSEIESVLRAGLKRMHLPGALVRLASLCAKLRFGHFFREMRPIDSLAGSRVPVLFIHGERDDFIPPVHSERMCRAAGEWGELCLIPGAGHAASVLTDPALYRDRLTAFLVRVRAIPDPERLSGTIPTERIV